MTDMHRPDPVIGDDTPFGPYIRQFLGRQVRVTLDPGLHAEDDRARRDPGAVLRMAVTIEGRLVHATDDGEVTLVADDGSRHYAWPGLHIEVLP